MKLCSPRQVVLHRRRVAAAGGGGGGVGGGATLLATALAFGATDHVVALIFQRLCRLFLPPVEAASL